MSQEDTSVLSVRESEKTQSLFVICLVAALSIWNFDRLHYILFQLVFVLLLPTILRLRNGSVKTISAEKDCQTRPLVIESSSKQNLTSHYDFQYQDPESPEASTSNSSCLSETPLAPMHGFSKTCEVLFEEFEAIANSNVENSSICWELMVDISNPIPLTVYRDRHAEHRYRLECVFDNTPAAVFDLMSELFDSKDSSTSAKKYLRVLEKLEVLDKNTDIIYFCTTSFWPTSARDACLLQSSKNLEDGSIMTVLQSVNHPLKGKDVIKDAVRMDLHLMGRWLRPIAGCPKKCTMVTYLHGDPQGWIPKSLITFMASNFVPRLFDQINNKIALLPFKERSLKLVNYFMGSPTGAMTELTLNDETYSLSPTSSILDLPSQSEACYSAPTSSKVPASLLSSNRALAPPLSAWERIKKLPSRWWIRKVATTSTPILFLVAILAVMARRNRP
ncbi:hypothetical protein DSO57_1004726 [Entomophthora muscae]|uniref:Uncharacterized protein n=1 Tax=Entomophthora muscae TaxID=34485 RepID=A0ACC2TJB9_9FUNG|nr:hypothetical protein DSO57_1004726 [Entomophthora muscae]